jgi:type II secretory pathway component PulJ
MTTRGASARGFSVLEALISLALFLFVLTAAFSVYGPSRLIYSRGETQTEVQQHARLAMAEMARQIRMAGYFPENFAADPADPLLADPVLLATHDFLALHGDLDGSDASSAFGYCRDGSVLRRTQAARDDADAFDCATGVILAEHVTDLRFTYYDAAGDPVPDPPTAPYALDDQSPGDVPEFDETAARDSVRRVVFSLTVEAPAPQGKTQTYHLTSDAWLRNAG